LEYCIESVGMNKGVTVWFTGLPCSGKTTIADKLALIIKEKGKNVERLDGDIVRKGLTRDLGFSKEDRDMNIERVTFVAKLLTRNNVVVLATFVSPYIARRQKTREEIGEYIEVYVKASLEECIKRDVKGMYKKALAGEIKNFTGIDDPYEAPPSPEIIVDTDVESVDESVEKVLKYLEKNGFL
jgi:adenylylsulfate kinase